MDRMTSVDFDRKGNMMIALTTVDGTVIRYGMVFHDGDSELRCKSQLLEGIAYLIQEEYVNKNADH